MNDENIDQMLAETINTGYCPDCDQRGFVIGPMGGVAINIECANLACRSRFNVVPFGGRILRAERIERGSEWPSEPRAHRGSFS